MFTPSTAFGGLAADINRRILGNTDVQPGILTFGSDSYFSILTSSNISRRAETIGQSDYVQLDFTSIFPDSTPIGAQGRTDFAMLQLLAPKNPTSENGLSFLDIAASRASAGLVEIPTLNGTDAAQVFNLPFTVAEGSTAWRYFGKGLLTVGSAGAGGLSGAVAGTVIPGLGNVAGAIIGAGSGLFTGLGLSIINNTKGDTTPDPAPADLKPSPLPAVPEPSTYVMFALGLLVLLGLRLRRDRHREKPVDIASARGRFILTA
jgi:hypothetical protein